VVLSVCDLSNFLYICLLAVCGTNGELFKVLMQRHSKWVKNLICHELLVPLMWVIFFLSRERIPRVTCVLIIWENFDTKLFCVIRQYNLTVILTGFHTVQSCIALRRGYVLRNASVGDFVIVRTSLSVLTQT
jgi:hypothetical protein